MDLKSVEPNDLVRRIQAGCNDSATELSNRFTPRLLAMLQRRLGGSRTDAEDIAQESLTRAFQNLSRFDFNYQFSTWLYTIAFRLATDFVRKEKRRPKLFPMETLQHDPSVDARRTVSISSVVAENVWSLARSALVESQYTILWLRYGEGLSILQIANVLKKTQIGVRVQLHRARCNLAKEISRMDREQTNTSGRNQKPS